MEARRVRKAGKEEKKAETPKRRVMAVGMRTAGGSWWIRSRFRIEPQTQAGDARASTRDRVA